MGNCLKSTHTVRVAAPIKTTKANNFFSFDGCTIQALVVGVYDADTITVQFTLIPDSKIFRDELISNQITNISSILGPKMFKVRLLGIDTPEMKPSKNAPNREKEKAKAVEARDVVRDFILNKVITLHTSKYDKYGRILAHVDFEDHDGKRYDLSDWLVEHGYANKYDGGTKSKFDFEGDDH